LNGNAEKMEEYGAEWYDQSWEINLIKNVGIILESIHGGGNTVGVIRPDDGTREIKQEWRNAIGRDFCNPAENDKIYKRGKERLQKNPYRSQESLLVTCQDIPAHKTEQEIFVLKKFPKVKPIPWPV